MIFKCPACVIACICLLPLLSTAQEKPDSYTASWKTVDSLIDKKGLTTSALARVNLIYTRARQEKNEPQTLKALLYRIRLQVVNQDDAGTKAIATFEKEIPGAQQPARSILQNILAEVYWEYLQQHRYQLYNRTATINFRKDSIATWDADDFHKRISELYLASLQDETLLRATRLEAYDPVIVKGNTRTLRPTLFDLLAHRALDYFKTGENTLTRPAYVFEMDDPAVFSDAATFARHIFKTTDSLSLHYKALLLLQRLISLHLADAKPDALLDVDIERLTFVHGLAVMENKEDLYTSALAHITAKWPNEPAAAEAWYLQAQQHYHKGATYDPVQDTAGRYEYIAAKAICEKVTAQKDSSEGKVHCTQLLRHIHSKTLTMHIENVNLPGQPFRSLVKWRNLSRFYGRIVRLDHATREALGTNTYQDSYWQKLLQLPVQRTFIQTLPETGDYQTHATEISIDSLPVGAYALIAGTDSSFRLGENIMVMENFYISNIAFVNNNQDYFVLGREGGQPLTGANVQIWSPIYDAKTSRNILTRAETYRTDEHGQFQVRQEKDKRRVPQIALEISAGADHLFLEEQYHLFYRLPDQDETTHTTADKLKYEKDNLHTYFFTDRAIYRPGQTLLFKGMVVTRDFDTRRARIMTQFPTKVILYDANGGKVDSLQVTTNDFGSYHGSFKMPENLLNGEFRIADDSTGQQQSFSVEEYKRPLFYVSYDTLKDSYRLGDTVRVQGSARAFAGNVIDGATVNYRVTRQARIPCFDCWPMRNYTPRQPVGKYIGIGSRINTSQSQEITHGIAHTDAKGAFTIAFAALADRSINKDKDPIFEYTISADITDINGETRSGTTMVRAGYRSLELTITQPSEDLLPADSLGKVIIRATNLNGAPQPTLVHVTMYALKAPDRLIRSRFWEEPDQFVLSREEYLRSFPHDEYGNETSPAKWEKGNKIFETTDSVAKSLIIPRDKELSPGWYVVEAHTNDKSGQTVKTIRYINLYDGKTGTPANPQYNWALQDESTLEPGGKAIVDIGSSAGNIFVIRKLSTSGSKTAFSFLTLDKEKKSVEYPVTEADRGGFGLSDVFVKDNRIYTRLSTVKVPWTNKNLSIHYDTYRDKVLPGSEEKWKLTIRGQQADKVAAEVVAGMYDASLDEFKFHSWPTPYLFPVYQPGNSWLYGGNFAAGNSQQRYIQEKGYSYFIKQYDALLGMGLEGSRQVMHFARALGAPRPMLNVDRATEEDKSSGMFLRAEKIKKDVVNYADSEDMSPFNGNVFEPKPGAPTKPPTEAPVQVRKNFSETAFFFPNLRTDDSGSVTFSFTMPEALTRWKGMIFTHTRDLAYGLSEKTIVTQKQLMVQPNAPRFIREGDRMELGVKVANLTDSEMTGQIELQLIDPTTGQTADGLFSNRQANQYFTVGAGQSTVVAFPLDVPYQYNRPLTYRIIARSKEYSDGEEAVLPVVSNRMLVTESLPLNIPGDGSKEFHFDKLLQSGASETLNHHALTVEFTSNPAWYAVQALPYLMEYPYECAEQTFNRFYANALASHIAGSSPRLQQIFARWKTTDTAALLSNLEKNQELKSVLLQETPWVLQGKSESQQRQHIALLFDMSRMSRELESSLTKLKNMQGADGGFVWFKGGPDDRYITQYILTGIGHLQKLNALPPALAGKLKEIVMAALPYLDGKLKKDYEDLLKLNKVSQPKPKPGPIPIGELPVQYLYMRSFFNDYGIPGDVFPAVNYFRKQAQQQWLQYGKYMQGMIALALFRTGDIQTAKDIMASLRETAIRDEEKGMYWKGMEGGYYWWQAPIETQSLLTEAFHEIVPGAGLENALRTWLLKQKQTHSWPTTKATADACYALLMDGGDWLSAERDVTIRLGDKTISSSPTSPSGAGPSPEAGTGYFKQVIDGPFVRPSMGNITVTLKTLNSVATPKTAGTSPAWGAVYWQYFENLDKITAASGNKAPLRLTKKLFIERNTDRGPVLEPIKENGVLHPGDKVRVRIELQSDRDMEYVHMKDMRAACMEPVNVLSTYKWQGGLGYYESTRDASTDFFFSHLPRGTFVFEYPLFVGQAGNFSNGTTSIECMYAPEFGFHSEGIRVNVEEVLP